MGETDETNASQTREEKAKKFVKYIKALNIITALILIVLSVLSAALIIIDAITSLKFFLILSPLFMTAFGVCLLAAEFKVRFILKRVPVLKSLLGKAVFYLYLSSVIYYYFSSVNNPVLAWVGAVTLFVSGVLYLAIHFGCAKVLKREDLEEEYQESYKERLV